MAAVEATGLRRSFASRVAVDGLDLRVDEGETLALLGPNGAGKTTTVSMLTTVLRPDGGHAVVAGHDVVREPAEVRKRIGVVFQGPSLEFTLSARQNLRLHARLYAVPRAEAEPRIAALLAEAGLADRDREPVRNFSGGMRRRLEIARAVLHRPRVLFLDEPTVGLDPQSRLHAWKMIQDLQAETGVSVLLTTHDMAEADRLARRVAIMDHGRLIEADTPERLKASLAREMILLRADGRGGDLAPRLRRLRGVQGVEARNGALELHVDHADEVLPSVLAAASRARVKVRGLDVRRPTLEDVFIARTGHALRDPR